MTTTVRNEQDSTSEKNVFENQFVHLEIMASVETQLADIAEARNYSIPLKAWTLANYRNEFQWFLDALGEDFVKYINVSENDEQPVSIMELIQIMCATNPKLRTAEESYKNVSKGLTYFIDPQDKYSFKRMKNIAKDVVKLNDHIRWKWKDFYNVEDESGKRGKFGSTSEAKARKRRRTAMATYYFLNPDKKPIVGDVPIEKGLSLPVLSAFRALLNDSEDQLTWKTDPFKFIDQHGRELVKTVMSTSKRYGGDPHSVGRDGQAWDLLYLTVSHKFVTEATQNLNSGNQG